MRARPSFLHKWTGRTQLCGERREAGILHHLFDGTGQPPGPVGMLIDGAGHIGLRPLTEDIFHIGEDDP